MAALLHHRHEGLRIGSRLVAGRSAGFRAPRFQCTGLMNSPMRWQTGKVFLMQSPLLLLFGVHLGFLGKALVWEENLICTTTLVPRRSLGVVIPNKQLVG